LIAAPFYLLGKQIHSRYLWLLLQGAVPGLLVGTWLLHLLSRDAGNPVVILLLGVILGGLSFLLMVLPTSGNSGDTYKMAAWWIVGSYLLLGLGDILLETSGMSATTKLAPKAFASQFPGRHNRGLEPGDHGPCPWKLQRHLDHLVAWGCRRDSGCRGESSRARRTGRRGSAREPRGSRGPSFARSPV